MKKYSILTCGSNGRYQLGIGTDEDQNVLRKALFNIENTVVDSVSCKPLKISSGGNHTIVLFEDGNVYSAGDNSFGQCGHPSLEYSIVEVFTRVESQNAWADISCGWEFSILVDSKNRVFLCGRGVKGELGLGQEVTESEIQEVHQKFELQIESVRSSVAHTVLKLASGEFYGWGSCRKGQLGPQPFIEVLSKSKPKPCLWSPELLHFEVDEIKGYSLGHDFTSFFKEHEVLVFGKGAQALTFERSILGLECMWSSHHVLVDSDEQKRTLLSFGNNSHGQFFPKTSLNIDLFVVGSEHGLFLTQNKVYSWGWGEHGNCGQHKEKNSQLDVTFDYANPLYQDISPVKLLSGGCATSWIVIDTSTP